MWAELIVFRSRLPADCSRLRSAVNAAREERELGCCEDSAIVPAALRAMASDQEVPGPLYELIPRLLPYHHCSSRSNCL